MRPSRSHWLKFSTRRPFHAAKISLRSARWVRKPSFIILYRDVRPFALKYGKLKSGIKKRHKKSGTKKRHKKSKVILFYFGPDTIYSQLM